MWHVSVSAVAHLKVHLYTIVSIKYNWINCQVNCRNMYKANTMYPIKIFPWKMCINKVTKGAIVGSVTEILTARLTFQNWHLGFVLSQTRGMHSICWIFLGAGRGTHISFQNSPLVLQMLKDRKWMTWLNISCWISEETWLLAHF